MLCRLFIHCTVLIDVLIDVDLYNWPDSILLDTLNWFTIFDPLGGEMGVIKGK